MCEALEELFMEIMPDRVQKLMDEPRRQEMKKRHKK